LVLLRSYRDKKVVGVFVRFRAPNFTQPVLIQFDPWSGPGSNSWAYFLLSKCSNGNTPSVAELADWMVSGMPCRALAQNNPVELTTRPTGVHKGKRSKTKKRVESVLNRRGGALAGCHLAGAFQTDEHVAQQDQHRACAVWEAVRFQTALTCSSCTE
jgi:hypothetical protein